MTDLVDFMNEINASYADNEFLVILLCRIGVCDELTIKATEHVDSTVVSEFLASIATSDGMGKLLRYLRN